MRSLQTIFREAFACALFFTIPVFFYLAWVGVQDGDVIALKSLMNW